MQPSAVKPLIIGSLIIDPPLLLAPMAGFTTHEFRCLVRRLGGLGLAATEMVSARGLYHSAAPDDDAWRPVDRSAGDRLWGIAEEPRPLAVQIWDNDPAKMAAVGAWLAHRLKAGVVDLNFGCPVRDVAEKAQSGAYLLGDPDRVGRIVAQVAAACAPVPVTAKIRLGPSRERITAGDVAQAVEDSGGAALVIHGRTAADGYRGRADWDAIAAVKSRLRRIPLVGNGDLTCPADIVQAFARYGVDGVMIGRAALGRPWLFSQAAAALVGRPVPPDPPLDVQRRLLLDYFAAVVARHGPRKGTVLMRKHACCWAHNRPGARAFRAALGSVSTPEQFAAAVAAGFSQ